MVAAGEEGFLCQGRRYSYESIDRNDRGCDTRGCRPVHRGPRRNILVACILFCAVMGIATFRFVASGGPRLPSQPEEVDIGLSNTPSLHVDSSAPPGLQVRVSNQYQRGENATTDLSLYPWEHVAEPYRETTLELTSLPEGVQGGANIIWKIEDKTVAEGADKVVVKTFGFTTPGQYKAGNVAVSTCTAIVQNPENSSLGVSSPRTHTTASDATASAPSTAADGKLGRPGPFPATAEGDPAAETDSDGEVFVHEFIVTVKYVRREIRDLTDRDRETYFNAVSVLQRVPSAVGRAVYGDKYYSKDYFNRIHLYYGGGRDCDHWHEGAGFVTAHIAITLMYEQALQAVNPSIALPYWDVTIEGTFYDSSSFRDSPIFSDDWFGEGAPHNSFKTPYRGRFAYVPVMTDAREYSLLTNPYGLLRSPWNTDPNPFLTRSDHLLGFLNNKKPSGCRKFRDAYDASNWMQLTEAFNGGAHGNVHGILGGTWSPEADKYASATPNIVIPFVHHAYISQKVMWRTNAAIDCPVNCTFEQPWERCQCRCNETLMEGRTAAEFLEFAEVLSSVNFYDKNFNIVENLADSDGHFYEEIPGYTKNETVAMYEGLRDVLCIPTKVGSHFEATSTNDHTFWVLHGAFDRLWHLSRLKQPTVFNETWISDNTCTGHNEFDVQPFHDLFLEEHGDKPERGISGSDESVGPVKGYYTNGDLYDLLHPGKMDLPYVYDNFAWPNCYAQGVYIN